jgi:hypothetical protein
VLPDRRGRQLISPPVQARRGGPLAALVAAVLITHLWLAGQALPDRIGEGASDSAPARMAVTFVRTLAPTAPPAPVAAGTRPARPVAARAPARAASAPAPDTPDSSGPVLVSAPELPDFLDDNRVAAASAPPPASDAASHAVSEVAAAAPTMPLSPPDPAASAPLTAFEWPPSTRLSYRLTGNYRGPVEGQARVEWLRSGSRYQVFMDLGIGPSFAPLMSRRVSSDGDITAQGLQPRRYDEETKVVLMAPRRLNIQMDDGEVRMADGSRLPRPPGLQDSASQFVQLTWLFTTQPELLQPGRSITLPLALPRRVEPWVYDVLGSETLATPTGPVDAVHVKPRRVARPGVDMTAEIWVAPSLQYLPVRILIRVDAETYIDLNIERLPEQAEPGK